MTERGDGGVSAQDAASTRFYVYTLAKPTGEVFYVGKGSGKRVHQHVLDAKSNRGRDLRHFVIRDLLSRDETVVETIAVDGLTEAQALRLESTLISAYAGEHLTNGKAVPADILAAFDDAQQQSRGDTDAPRLPLEVRRQMWDRIWRDILLRPREDIQSSPLDGRVPE